MSSGGENDEGNARLRGMTFDEQLQEIDVRIGVARFNAGLPARKSAAPLADRGIEPVWIGAALPLLSRRGIKMLSAALAKYNAAASELRTP